MTFMDEEMTPTQPLGRTDVLVPRLGLGAMTWGDATGLARLHPAKLTYGSADGLDEERAAWVASIAAAVTLFDTAAMYSNGASERRLGEFSDPAALIATKFPGSLTARADDMPKELDASLGRLRRARVDLYQHHFPTRRVDIPRLMQLMADAVAAGTVRAVGVSNYSATQMRQAHAVLAARGIPLASNQVQYSLLHRRPETDGVLDTCRELGVTLIAHQPLAGGALTGKYHAGDRPRGIRRFGKRFRGRGLEAVEPVSALLREIGQRHDRTAAQVALRWLVENDVVLPIPGAKNAQQATANAGALTFRLGAEEIAALDTTTRAWR
jgi:aryl-alcohol dehydrogenase-like predicted oxidoreductase